MRVSLNQRRARAERFLDTLTERIDHIECQLQAFATPVIGTLTAVTPSTVTSTSIINSTFWSPWWPDASNPRYSGSPYYRTWHSTWP